MSVQLKAKIQEVIQNFSTGNLTEQAMTLFRELGYNTERQDPFPKKTYRFFNDSFIDPEDRFNETRALVDGWKYVDLLFQISRDEITMQYGLLDTKTMDRTAIETYLFMVIELEKNKYTRTDLSGITREINKVFPMPVMVLFKYGVNLTLSVINRRIHKRDRQKDVLEKVTLIKDISISNPHRAHIEILHDLSFNVLLKKFKFRNFVELHNAWQSTLDTKELNNRFYQELANWYFWAMDHVVFPDDIEKNKEIRNAVSLIRLITRVIFVWFIKEKSLVPDVLFDQAELSKLLKDFETDKESHGYYQAILQNLFFGAMNQKIGERAFAGDGDISVNKKEYGVKNLFRYKNHFDVDESRILSLFQSVPFLNGGLFDCLDIENDQGKVLYYDGFSRNPKKSAIVPDFLFFSSEKEYDLNETFGTKNKRYKVKGLIDILHSYKFTVTENTPIEEEVALDPELLGRVFENLLASYIPETEKTARKQTGSFYTPREIVNYMVDESLKNYLRHSLMENTNLTSEDVDVGLDILFSYTEREHAFSHGETQVLIKAIDECKILDPACGSGAFPMGILHKLVHVLHKLDPGNQQWKERQVQKASQIDDPSIRDKVICDIESAFENNELDYGRKLYLIENCIYGVDIQPIAVQIAKLRFFISLVVDQKKKDDIENFGIRSLPNLETKFVAANTLIGVAKPEKQPHLFENKEIRKYEDELKQLRHRYFSAKTRQEKLTCQRLDKELRQKISTLLVKEGWAPESAKQIVQFDPYDQNASSPFFDPEWMFGLKPQSDANSKEIIGAFDIIIANPPYVRVDDIIPEHKLHYKKAYVTSEGKYDLYYLFFEIAIKLKSKYGIIVFITPNKFCAAISAQKLRSILLKQFVEIVSTSKLGVFIDVSNYPIITLLKETEDETELFVREAKTLENLYQSSASAYILKKDDIKIMPEKVIPINVSQKKIDTILYLLSKNSKFKDFIEFSEGLRIPSSLETENEELNNHKIVKQYQFKKWSTITKGSFISEKNLTKVIGKTSKRYRKIFTEKILVAEDALEINATLDCDNHIPQGGLYFGACLDGSSKSNRIILALLNSRLLSSLYEILFGGMHMGGGYLRYRKNFLEELPIKIELLSIDALETIANFILFINGDDESTLFFTNLLNAIVYELYFPEDVKFANCEILLHLRLPKFGDDLSDIQKHAIIEEVYRELSDPAHPVRIAMFKMETIEEVRIIEGKK
jgi:adenine-specific DNA-methyltransferase